MGYFRELPDLEYLSPLADRTSASEYITVKNIFRRVKIREDLQNSFTTFNKYQIPDNVRPEQVAEELYGSQNLDWVVLISAGITNVRDQWPLSSRDIYEYAEKIYGFSMNDIHHYETIEVKDSTGRLILPSGKIVDGNFKMPTPETDSEPSRSYVEYYDSGLQQMVKEYDVTVGITNYQYEEIKNESKRGIFVLKKSYLQQFLNDSRRLMRYSQSTQYLNDKLKRGENIRVKSP
jgi:hypothetical protein